MNSRRQPQQPRVQREYGLLPLTSNKKSDYLPRKQKGSPPKEIFLQCKVGLLCVLCIIFGLVNYITTTTILQNHYLKIIKRDEEKGQQHFTHSLDRQQNRTKADHCNPRNFLVFVKAGSKREYQQRRDDWRKSICPITYKKFNIPYHFMLGMPANEIIDPNRRKQGLKSSRMEIEDMERIQNESRVHKDMVFLALKDVYNDFHLKVARILEWAVDRQMTHETSMVILHDDDFCLQPNKLQTICENTPHSASSLYGGNYFWNNATAAVGSQKKHDGSFTPYFSGNLYVLSADLVRDIVFDPATLFSSMQVGNSEDVQVGIWVDNQAKRKNRTIAYRHNKSLAISIVQLGVATEMNSSVQAETTQHVGGKVNCGGHFAQTCADCPEDYGKTKCNGVCVWSSENGGVCKPK